MTESNPKTERQPASRFQKVVTGGSHKLSWEGFVTPTGRGYKPLSHKTAC
jgi:hypothetical protein